MIKGVSVNVYSPVGATGETDRFGEPIFVEPTKTVVDNVLVSPGATEDLEATRPDGVTVAYTLHFPKSFCSPLRGCIVELPAPWAGTYRVIGDPHPYIDANTPTKWHMPVEIEAVYG